MKKTKYSFKTLASLMCFMIFIPLTAANIPGEMWKNVSDYTFMYFPEPPRDNQVFNIQTNNYFLSFDYGKFQLTHFFPVDNPLPEAEAHRQDAADFTAGPESDFLSCALVTDGKTYNVTNGPGSVNFCQLIESGKFFQRRYIQLLGFEDGAPKYLRGFLEISAWPDRISFVFSVLPLSGFGSGSLEMEFSLPDVFNQVLSYDEAKAFTNGAGAGYIFMKENDSDEIVFDEENQTCLVRFAEEEWPTRVEKSIGLVIYPSLDCAAEIEKAVVSEENPLDILAIESEPLDVSYDKRHGWYNIALQNDGNTANDRIENVLMVVSNNNSTTRTVRLNFAKDGSVFGVTGLSAMLRGAYDQQPLGIPIQISKNWHRGSSPEVFEGPWYHGLSMLTVPPNSTVEFMYTSVNALWGTVPAASHAQLCLVGWGGNQLWEETAIGSWGESICYDPESLLASSMVCDVRPLLVTDMNGTQGSWTNNVGGADFFRIFKDSREYMTHMKTYYKSYGPNLTEVSYAGQTPDGSGEFIITTNLARTDDVVRGQYHVRFDVKNSMDFNKFVIFEAGSDTYSYTKNKKFAWGNETGLINEWDTQWGGQAYKTDVFECSGQTPWFSMHEAEPYDGGASANRGIIVKNWNARIGGKDVPLYAAEYGADVNGGVSLIELLPPPGTTTFLPGDYIEADIELVIVPQYAIDYYGPNTSLPAALNKYENTWQMIYREAVGNDLDVSVVSGELLRIVPLKVQVENGSTAELDITGGIGYVPITFTGVLDYRDPQVYKQVDGIIEKVDQANHGNDYWQTVYDPETNTWELTFNIPLDSLNESHSAKILFGTPTSISEPSVRVADFRLHQNYPNPFNPSTTIRFDMLGRADVSLEIFNILGERVKVLVNTTMNAGSHYVTWDGMDDSNTRVSSGVYFMRLKADDFIMNRKLMLLK